MSDRSAPGGDSGCQSTQPQAGWPGAIRYEPPSAQYLKMIKSRRHLTPSWKVPMLRITTVVLTASFQRHLGPWSGSGLAVYCTSLTELVFSRLMRYVHLQSCCRHQLLSTAGPGAAAGFQKQWRYIRPLDTLDLRGRLSRDTPSVVRCSCRRKPQPLILLVWHPLLTDRSYFLLVTRD